MDINTIGNFSKPQSGSPLTTTPSFSPASAVMPDAEAQSGSIATPASTGSTTPGSADKLTAEQAKKAVDTINASLTANGNSQNVQFAVDPSSKRVVIQVIDKQTNTVIRQIPNEDIIQMSMTADKKLGQVISQKA